MIEFLVIVYVISFVMSLAIMVHDQYVQSKSGRTIKLFDIFESVFVSTIPIINTIFWLTEFPTSKLFSRFNVVIFKGTKK